MRLANGEKRLKLERTRSVHIRVCDLSNDDVFAFSSEKWFSFSQKILFRITSRSWKCINMIDKQMLSQPQSVPHRCTFKQNKFIALRSENHFSVQLIINKNKKFN